MKACVVSLGLLGLAVASPTVLSLRDAPPADAYDDSKGMKWIGEIFPGKSYTLYGDAASLYAQILAINPAYVAQAPSVTTREASKRSKNNGYCGNFATAYKPDAEAGERYLNSIGGVCVVNGNSCIRMTCNNTSGLYLCNDNSYSIQPSCAYLATYANDIVQQCAQPQFVAVSGQEFDTDRYNVVVAYANCNHSPSQKPNTYAQPGPNGSPDKTCSQCIPS